MLKILGKGEDFIATMSFYSSEDYQELNIVKSKVHNQDFRELTSFACKLDI